MAEGQGDVTGDDSPALPGLEMPEGDATAAHPPSVAVGAQPAGAKSTAKAKAKSKSKSPASPADEATAEITARAGAPEPVPPEPRRASTTARPTEHDPFAPPPDLDEDPPRSQEGAGDDEHGPIIRVIADGPVSPETPPAVEAARAAIAAETAKAATPDEGEPPAAGAHPNPYIKVATGVAFGLVAIAVIVFGGRLGLGILAGLLITWASFEYFSVVDQASFGQGVEAEEADEQDGASRSRGRRATLVLRRPPTLLAVGVTAIMSWLAYSDGADALGLIVIGAIVAAVVWFSGTEAPGRAPALAVMSVAGLVHIGVLGSFAMLILSGLQHGFALLLVVAIFVIVNDVAAYGWGSTLGKHPFAPEISPNKSLEGFLGAFATTVIAGVVVVVLQGSLYEEVAFLGDYRNVLVLAVVVAVAATLGDLAESLIKRSLGIKDIGGLLPGHGGMFDRFDAMVFALPAAYLAMRLLGAELEGVT